jgi:hypothetical protein
MGSPECCLWLWYVSSNLLCQGVYKFEVGVYAVVFVLEVVSEGCSYAYRGRLNGVIAVTYTPDESSGASSMPP